MDHVLVVGGTGMLREASLALASRAAVVSVVARPAGRLEALAADAARIGVTIDPVPVDDHDTAALRSALDEALRSRGPAGLAVCWIHRTARDAPLAVATVSPRFSLRFMATPGLLP